MDTLESESTIDFKKMSFKWVYFFIGWYWAFAFCSEYAYWSSFGISLFDHASLTEILVKSAESLLKILLLIIPSILVVIIFILPRTIFQKICAKSSNAPWFGPVTVLIEILTLAGSAYLVFLATNQFSSAPEQTFIETLKPNSFLVILVYISMIGFAAICAYLLKRVTNIPSKYLTLPPLLVFFPIFIGVSIQVSSSNHIKSGQALESRHVITCESAYFSCDEKKSIFLIGQLSDRWYFWNLDSESVFAVRSGAIDTISLATQLQVYDKKGID